MRAKSESPSDQSHGVGGTPLVRLRRIAQGPVEVHVKCEWMNPAGSVKDRPALWMIRDAEDRGLLLDRRRRLLDSTSGNTGIALAQLAAARGHQVTLTMPSNHQASSPHTKSALAMAAALPAE